MNLLHEVRQDLVGSGNALSNIQVADRLRERGVLLSEREVQELQQGLADEMFGYGPLQPLFSIPGITDVLVNSPNQVYFDAGQGLVRAEVEFANEGQVRALAQRLAVQLNQRLDEANPHLEAISTDGHRVHAVVPPISGRNTCISIRVPGSKTLALTDLVNLGAVGEADAERLRQMVQAKRSFLVSGATGAGKTTVLTALIGEVSVGERVVMIEDTPELIPAHPHLVRLLARNANVEGAGEVTLTSLVRQALRMRPDRLVVGEVRGHEVVALLNAFNTGHPGGGTTIHANSARDALERVELLGLLAGLPSHAVISQIRSAIDTVIHLERDASGVRRVVEIARVRDLLGSAEVGQELS
jgi:pilus assembly protein CpaF